MDTNTYITHEHLIVHMVRHHAWIKPIKILNCTSNTEICLGIQTRLLTHRLQAPLHLVGKQRTKQTNARPTIPYAPRLTKQQGLVTKERMPGLFGHEGWILGTRTRLADVSVVSVPGLWNSLPDNIRSFDNLSTFKSRGKQNYICVRVYTKLRYKTTAKTVYDQPCPASDKKDRDQSKLIKL